MKFALVPEHTATVFEYVDDALDVACQFESSTEKFFMYATKRLNDGIVIVVTNDDTGETSYLRADFDA